MVSMSALLMSCGASTTQSNPESINSAESSIGYDYTANAAAINRKKQEMLSVADGVDCFLFSDDTAFQSMDPHTYWLMNRMMHMARLVQTADDNWAWMLAMNESVEEYSHRLGCKIDSVEAACNAIAELIGIYDAGSQPYRNTASFVRAVLGQYRTVYAYYELIESFEYDYDENLQSLYYREFKEWFNINAAVCDIVHLYTYAGSGYSSLPRDLNEIFEKWQNARLAELDIERKICGHGSCDEDWEPFESNAASISSEEFDRLMNYFDAKTRNDIVEKTISYWKDNAGFFGGRFDERFDFDKIAEQIHLYKTALTSWKELREQISMMFAKEKCKPYREITRQMHTRFYYDLADLKDIKN